jgi:hypothetical protein
MQGNELKLVLEQVLKKSGLEKVVIEVTTNSLLKMATVCF